MTPLPRLASAAVAATLALGLLAGCGDDPAPTSGDSADDPAGTPSQRSDAPSEPAGTDTGEPSSEPTDATSEPAEPDDGTEAAPVYFTGDSPMGQRLYREFREVGSDNPMAEAAALLVAGDALDPDYGTLLQGVTLDDVTEQDGTIVVTLGEDSVTQADKGLAPKDAALAVQSLVYTLQGVAQSREPVRVQLADGSPVDLFGQPTGEGVTAKKQLDVLSLVNITTPEEGAVVSGGTLHVEGMASSFEATVPYRITDSSGQEVVNWSAMAKGWFERLYPWEADIDVSKLPSGDYVLHALTDDPTGGEGPGPFEDTRSFTLE